MTARKPNGNGTTTTAVALALLQQATENNKADLNNLGRKLDDHAVGTEKRLDSLEQSRAEGKGRAAVIAFAVSALVSMLGGIIVTEITRDAGKAPPVEVTPTVIVTLTALPQAAPSPQPTATFIIYRPGAVPSGSPQPQPTATVTVAPVPSPPIFQPPNPATLIGSTVERVCRPIRFLWWLLRFCT